jgi:hypothetical protein
MKQPLDKLLRDWAASHEPDAAARRQLEARVVRAARRKLHNGGPAPVPAPRHRPSPRQLHHLLWFAAGMAATILIAVVWHFAAAHAPAPAPAASPLAEERGLFAGRHRSMVRIFRETEQLFGSNLQWVAQSGDEAELGVSQTSAEGRPLVVRLVIVARPLGNGAWRRLWETEVVARANATLDLTPAGRPDDRLMLWMHCLEGGAALVESRLMLHGPVTIEAETSEVLKFGATRKVTRVLHEGVEYLLLQTVAPVDGGESCRS